MDKCCVLLDETLCFFAQHSRFPGLPMVAHYAKNKFQSKNEKKEERGKTLNYEKESKETREGLDISRKTEWTKWQQFTAGRPCKGMELAKLLKDGNVPIPTRWVDTDKNAHLRRDGGPLITAD